MSDGDKKPAPQFAVPVVMPKKKEEEPTEKTIEDANNVEDDDQDNDQDKYLPIANINRIMKRALSKNSKIAKDGKETVQECVSEFISFVTSEASEKCSLEKRKTINGEDILWALGSLGFEHYAEPLKAYLEKFRASVKNM